MTVTGTHRIPIDAFGTNLLTPPPFNRIITADEERTVRREGLDQQLEQAPANRQTRPHRTMQDAMVIDEMLFVPQAHHAQNSRHRALSTSQDGARDEYLYLQPCLAREMDGEQRQDAVILAMQGKPRSENS